MTTDKRSLSDIEAELGDDRERMGQTLDALQHRLSTDQIVEQGRGYLRASGGDEFIFNLGRSARRNPVPLALLGVGIGWLILSGSEQARRAAEQAGQVVARRAPDLNRGSGQGPGIGAAADKAHGRAKSTAGDLNRNAAQAAEGGQQRLAEAADRAQRGTSRAADNARRNASQLDRASRRVGRRIADGAEFMYTEQPLVTAGLGLAFGAVIAASLPLSTSENRAMGSARDDFVDSAGQAGQKKAGQIQSVAESAADAARNAARSEAEQQGIRDHES